MDTDSIIFQIKTEYFYEGIANDVEKWFDTSTYDDDVDRPLSKGMDRKKMLNQEERL